MLTLYKRHLPSCSKKNRLDGFQKKDGCKCPIWVEGTYDGTYRRRSLKTNSKAEAEWKIEKIKHEGDKPKTKSITIKDALDAYIEDCKIRLANDELSNGTLRKYRTVAARLQDFVSTGRIHGLDLFTDAEAIAFRGQWKRSALTLSKTIGHLKAFFNFCIARGWIQSNPFKNVKAPKIKTLPRIPFSEKEIQTILSKAEDDRELAFILTLRHTGLRIGDCSLLKLSQVSDGRVHLYTTKAGTPVSILIPETLASLLKALPPKGGYFFLRGESTHPHTASDLWRKRFKAICKATNIAPDHPHRFRHSLAAELLNKGASVEQVAAILGNSPAIVAKHYSQWIKSRQDNLDAFLEKTWAKPTLTRVK